MIDDLIEVQQAFEECNMLFRKLDGVLDNDRLMHMSSVVRLDEALQAVAKVQSNLAAILRFEGGPVGDGGVGDG